MMKSAKVIKTKLGKFSTVCSKVFLIGRLIPQKTKKLLEKIFFSQSYFFQSYKEKGLFDKNPLSNIFKGAPDLLTSIAGFLSSIYDLFKKGLKIKDVQAKLESTAKIRGLDRHVFLIFKKLQFLFSLLIAVTLIVFVLGSVFDFLAGKIKISEVLISNVSEVVAFLKNPLTYFMAAAAMLSFVKVMFKLNDIFQFEKTFQENFEKKYKNQNISFENLIEFLRGKELRPEQTKTIFDVYIDDKQTVSAKQLKDYLDKRDHYHEVYRKLIENKVDPTNILILLKLKKEESCLDQDIETLKKKEEKLREDSFFKKAFNSGLSKNKVDSLNDDLEDVGKQLSIKVTEYTNLLNSIRTVDEINFITQKIESYDDNKKKWAYFFYEIAATYQDEKKVIISKLGASHVLKNIILVVEGQRREKLQGKVVNKGIGIFFEMVGIWLIFFKNSPWTIPLLFSDLMWKIAAKTELLKLVNKQPELPWKKWGRESKRSNSYDDLMASFNMGSSPYIKEENDSNKVLINGQGEFFRSLSKEEEVISDIDNIAVFRN